MVTSRDVAAAAGVSQATVSRVLAGGSTVSDATRARVLTAMDAVGYVPNLSARAMKTGLSGTVGVVVADLANPFYPQLLDALGRAFDAAGRRVTVWVAEGAKNLAALQAIRERSVDGVVFTTVTEESAELRSALDRHSPVVLVNRTLVGVDCDQVASDNVAGGALVGAYLSTHDRRRPAFIGGEPTVATTRDRLAGFLHALGRAEIAPISVIHGEYTHRSGYEGMLALLDGSEPPDAVFCSNDLLAFGALDAARVRGLRVPDDVWVIGYDDVEMAAWESWSLTTVRQDVDRLAQVAADLLLRRLEQPTVPTAQVLLSPSICVRRSTGGAPDS
jgi:LacI family transcriptional regulator